MVRLRHKTFAVLVVQETSRKYRKFKQNFANEWAQSTRIGTANSFGYMGSHALKISVASKHSPFGDMNDLSS